MLRKACPSSKFIFYWGCSLFRFCLINVLPETFFSPDYDVGRPILFTFLVDNQ